MGVALGNRGQVGRELGLGGGVEATLLRPNIHDISGTAFLDMIWHLPFFRFKGTGDFTLHFLCGEYDLWKCFHALTKF